MSDTTSPFKSPEVAAKLLGNTGTRRVTDTTHETEKAVISTIAFSGASHRWTWALFRPTRIGAELYAEIPQQAHPDYATDQAVLAEIFALYPEIKYITSHPQMLSLWPSIECTFKRIQKPKGGTRLQLVSFTQRDHTREDEYSRDEQLLKLLGAKHMESDNLTDFFPRDENGQPVDDTPISDTPKPLLGRVHFEKDDFLVSGHIAKWLKLTDKADIGRATREAMGGKTWPELWPKQDEEPTPEQMQAAADNIARMADEYVSRHLSGQSFEMMLATARNTAMVTFGNYNVDASKDNFKAATGYDNALQYMSQPGASVEVLKKAIANWCLAHNATIQNEAAKNAATTNEKTPTGATTPESQSKSAEPPKNGQEAPKSNPVKTQLNGVKPVEPQQALAVVPNMGVSAMPMVAQWDIMRQQADVLIKSGFLPKEVKTAEQAIAIMLMGNALGIEPIVALSNINVISGKPTVSPQLMLALIRRSGQLESLEITDDGSTCTVQMKRRGEPMHVETFGMDDAKRMTTTEWVNGDKKPIPLADKYNWRAQPKTMRKWRAIAAACRIVFPDVTWGIASYTPEEMNPDIIIENEAA